MKQVILWPFLPQSYNLNTLEIGILDETYRPNIKDLGIVVYDKRILKQYVYEPM